MLRKLLSTLTVVVASATFVFAQNEGSLKVRLLDKANKETIPFANVVVEMGGIQMGIGTTNIDGELIIKPLNPGKYNVKATYVGYQAVELKDISVTVGKMVSVNIELAAGQQLAEVEVVEWTKPLIDPDTKSGGTVTAQEYQNMATKNINSVASTTAGVYQKDEGGALNVRGARSAGTAYYVDGQKVIGSSGVSQASVEQITTIVGGTPAEYGDATGGIISITTKGPASRYAGGIEMITSGLGERKGLDAYGYNFVGFSVSGPLLMKKDSANDIKKSILGFSVSGELVSEIDPDPSATKMYKVKDDKLEELENAPLRPSPSGNGFVLNTEYVTMDDLEPIKAKQNVGSRSMRLNGKIQYQPTTNMSITLGGSLDYGKKHEFEYLYALFNPVNNNQRIDNTWRAFIKLTQKFNNNTFKEEEKSSSIIKNAYFTIQAGYEKSLTTTQDDTHGKNFFDYGYIGKFTQEKKKFYTWVDVPTLPNGGGVFGVVDANTQLNYSPGDVNPLGAAYTNQVYDFYGQDGISTFTDVQFNLGLMNGDRPANTYSMWYNTGRQYGGYQITNKNQFRVFTNFSADIKKHAIQLGFEYEQRTNRDYSIGAIGLWTQMRQLQNNHISLNYNQPYLNPNPDPANPGIMDFYDPNVYDYYDFADSAYLEGQNGFDRNLRIALGLNPDGTDRLDIDSYDPSTFSLEMFSAEDLVNIGGTQYVTYYGYDHTGKILKGNPSLDDFFTATDENGHKTYQVGAYRPIYIAGYLQDRFDFKDLRFNVGVRIDRFDANQKVLKDKYLLYEAKTAGELSIPNRPSSVGDDYVVYVYDAQNPNVNQVVGYRNGDTWYDENGIEVQDAQISIATPTVNGRINPYLSDPASAAKKEITGAVFKDYVPQINVMPRIAFAFPISDVANFFAHYDILTQRPPDFNRLNPYQYLDVENNPGNYVNNPNLKSEKTIDYELGFAQVLNEKKNSVITLSVFYRELRDMIQTSSVYQAYPVTYRSFENVDFGTVKGFSIAYDLRRLSSGVQLTANYTLQFADGTGSSATDGQNLVADGQPNLRITHPLDFDQRHTVTLNMDYRFGAGKDYNGPRWTRKKGTDKEKAIDLLGDVGANVTFRAGSGTPYSQQGNITPAAQFGIQNTTSLEGGINAANLPWSFKMDLRVDKNMDVSWGGKKEGEEKKHANLNIYLQVLNILNTKNILSVYKATGDPTDDGYLSSAQAQTTISGQNSPTSFNDLYSVKLNNPDNFSRPRVIRLGLMLSF